MKALSSTLLIVITAVVILVAALVLLTIFGGGTQQVATVAQAESLCISEAQLACTTGSWQSSGSPTATWNVPTKKLVGGETKSCSQAVTSCTVSCTDRVFSCTKGTTIPMPP